MRPLLSNADEVERLISMQAVQWSEIDNFT